VEFSSGVSNDLSDVHSGDMSGCEADGFHAGDADGYAAVKAHAAGSGALRGDDAGDADVSEGVGDAYG